MLELIRQPWPWYVSGVLIALTMATMMIFGKTFGVSSNLRTICTMCGAGKQVEFFNFDWKQYSWNLLFIFGALIGGYIANTYLAHPDHVQVSAETVADLQALGLTTVEGFLPAELFHWDNLFTVKGLIFFVGGGFLVGFGTRYAGGCTSGHAITGLSTLQPGSLIAVVGFFIGGLLMTHVLLPLVFQL